MNQHFNALAPRIIGYAAQRAPSELTARLHEEWLADLRERTSALSRLRLALGCVWAAITISQEGSTVPSMVSTPATVQVPIAGTMMRVPGGPGRGLYRLGEGTTDSPAICDINTTPLIDVMLVLLITMILSLPLLNHAVKIELPHGPVLKQLQPQIIDLEIYFDGTVLWNGTPVVDMRQLEGYFQTEASKATQPEIRLRPSGHVKYEIVAQVLAAAQRNGMQKVGFANTGEFAR